MTDQFKDSAIARLGLLDPTAAKVPISATATIPSLKTLTGKRIGLLDNSKTNVSRLLAQIGDALVRDYGASALTPRTKLIYSRVAPLALIEELAGQCDAVVTAVGD